MSQLIAFVYFDLRFAFGLAMLFTQAAQAEYSGHAAIRERQERVREEYDRRFQDWSEAQRRGSVSVVAPGSSSRRTRGSKPEVFEEVPEHKFKFDPMVSEQIRFFNGLQNEGALVSASDLAGYRVGVCYGSRGYTPLFRELIFGGINQNGEPAIADANYFRTYPGFHFHYGKNQIIFYKETFPAVARFLGQYLTTQFVQRPDLGMSIAQGIDMNGREARYYFKRYTGQDPKTKKTISRIIMKKESREKGSRANAPYGFDKICDYYWTVDPNAWPPIPRYPEDTSR